MRDKEIELFVEALELAKEHFYIEAIEKFKNLHIDFPDSEVADDALFNIGLCYFNIKNMDLSIEYFQKTIHEYPQGTISILNGGNEYGNICAKCHYALMNIYLFLGDLENAKKSISSIESYPESYVVEPINETRITFFDLATKNFELYINQNNLR